MLVASNSPVKCFSDGEISRSLTEVALQAQSLSVVANHPKSDLFTVNRVAESEEIREVYSTEFLLNTATIREAKLDCI